MRYSLVMFGAILAAGVVGCKGKDSASADAGFLANASVEAKDALASPVDFQLTEDNFAKWEIAERNLDGVPPGEFSSAPAQAGSAVDRAVARLESSPRARRAIEGAGLSVRDFVLETVALAQAVQAAQLGRSTVASGVGAENFAFVERYRDRIRRSGLEADISRQSGDAEVTDPNTRAELESANADRIADSVANADTAGGEIRMRKSGGDSAADSLRD
ncbi:MAG: hypothetical protein H0W63_02840 [Gemmatimonadaceae bacterium]|nr:hypothetical protein [Gemmatimonadaceae bacterium]